MSLSPRSALPTRRAFGLGYLASVAALLAGGLIVYGLSTADTGLGIAVVVAVGAFVLAALAYVVYIFQHLDPSETLVWTVAQWTALGIAIGTLASIVLGFAYRTIAMGMVSPDLLVVTITTGALVGCLVGSVVSLRDQHLEVGDLSQRNAVLNRVLRHNIKNDMNVIMGHASLLGQEMDDDDMGSVDAIHRAATDVTRLSEAARTIDKLGKAPEGRDVDLRRIVRQSVDSADSFYPDATVSATLPDEAWVEASPVVSTVVANLIQNAIEHNVDDATVEVTVEHAEVDDHVHLAVADDGPGIYHEEREVLDAGEDPISHGSGMGLWLVKWFAQAYAGDLRFEDNDPQGTVVHLTLPAAEGDPSEREQSLARSTWMAPPRGSRTD